LVTGSHEDGAAHTLFTLLRFTAGSFTFESGATSPQPSPGLDVEPLLEEAERLLAEWHAIEAVVPSLDAWLSLRPELERDVVVDAARWRVIATIAGGSTAGAVGTSLRLGELDALRAVKELVELGLVEVGDEPAPVVVATEPSTSWARDLHTGEHEPVPPSLTEMRAGLGSVHLSVEDEVQSYTVHDMVQSTPEVADLAPPPPAPPAFTEPAVPAVPITHGDPAIADFAAPTNGEPSLDDAAEIARQLANLSPRAAKAVAAAAKATTDEEREAALAAIEAEDDTVNRGLLLRFLGSVDS
jgi:hypothetical protein